MMISVIVITISMIIIVVTIITMMIIPVILDDQSFPSESQAYHKCRFSDCFIREC